jgi:hypothetical protein
VLGVPVLLDVEVLLYDALRIGEERPLRTDGVAELVERVTIVGRDGDDPGVRDVDLRMKRCQLQMLLMLLRTLVPTGERQDERVVALELAQPPVRAGVVEQLVIGEDSTGDDVGTHVTPSVGRERRGSDP